ncbi:hypothetical protein PGQ11_013616 [Apiospora arundinis]|uniref:Uncharacterized protein n=1 Tax=Apiospora arundinis TaxID=335852 RepID=A0ABR2HPW6_9PEZI
MPGNTVHRVNNPRLRPYRTQPGRHRRNLARYKMSKSKIFTWMGTECMKTERRNCLGASVICNDVDQGALELVDKDWFHKFSIVLGIIAGPEWREKKKTHRQHPPSSREVWEFIKVIIYVAINTGIHHGFYGGFHSDSHSDSHGGFLGSIRAVIRAIIKAVKDLFFNVLDSDILAALVELLPLFQLFHN